MARTIYALTAGILLAAQLGERPAQPSLRELYDSHRYFDLREAVLAGPGADPEQLFYRGVVDNRFNRPGSSIRFLEQFLSAVDGMTDPRLAAEAQALLADSYHKSYEYRRAAEALRTLLERFGSRIPVAQRSSYENERALWASFAEAPRMSVSISGDSAVKLDRNGRVPLTINGHRIALAFDTGANLSVLSRSTADSLGLKTGDSAVQVGAIAGNRVAARTAVAGRLGIGRAIVRNALFLVMEDKDLFIAEANFQIQGLIGFPVIEALRQVTTSRDGTIRFPALPNRIGEPNMCLDGLTPLVSATVRGQRLTFAYDTGATHSTLYPPYFRQFRNEIEGKYPAHIERVRGVGGHRDIKGYLARNRSISIGGKEAVFTRIPILTEETTARSRYVYGNLGQDLIRQFPSATMNFVAMRLTFE